MPRKIKPPLEFDNVFANISDLGLVFVLNRNLGEMAYLIAQEHRGVGKTITNNVALSPWLQMC